MSLRMGSVCWKWIVGLSMLLTVAVTELPTRADEPLHRLFTEESIQDPFLTPSRAQTSGPLTDDWGRDIDDDLQRDPNSSENGVYELWNPDHVNTDDIEEDCTQTTTPPTPRRFLIDSSLTATWLLPADDFSVRDLEARTSLVIPVFVKKSPLRLALGFGMSQFGSPAALNLPDQVYGVQAEFRWLIPLKEKWAIDLGAGGGSFSDLDGTFVDGLRATGRAIVIREFSEHWKL
ncbi:MAG: hypothetical protein FJ267_18770, partial [Planctomycetes bacterium]|nr:hypothetical protein [Planctomycetota bacterium]